jgi:phosphate transport system permease protein
MDLYARRRLGNRLMIGFSCGAALLGVFCLAEIMWTLLINGISAINLDIFIRDTPPPPGAGGGLRNAIFGSIAMTAVATLAATPIGILAGTFLAEFAQKSRFGHIVRFVNDILLSSPSIIIGLFVYQLIVLRQHHFSAWAGAFALALIALPVIVRTAEDMLSLVPAAQREAAAALGAQKWRVIVSISFRAARQGLVTGVMLAIARISGETAPLLFTALGNLNWSTDMNGQMASLPKVIFDFAFSPYEDWQKLAWGGALLITVTILMLNIGARALSNWSSEAK